MGMGPIDAIINEKSPSIFHHYAVVVELTTAHLAAESLRYIRRPIASPDESNANVPGSGTGVPGPTPPPGVITPLLLPLGLPLAQRSLLTTFSFGAGDMPSKCTKVSAKALPQVICAPGWRVTNESAKIFPWNVES